MGATGGFPIDLILFGMIAAFLVLRLRNILGRRTGFERPQQPVQAPPARPAAAPGPMADGPAESVAPAAQRSVPAAESDLGRTLAQMKAIDHSFDAAGFLNGGEQAFRMIVTAFAAGNRATLKALLSDDTFLAFDQAITARETAGHTQVGEIRSIQSMTIEEAALRGTTGVITTRIVSDQISFTRDAKGLDVAGTEAVMEITDLWTFERDLAAQDPTWRLVAARSA